MIWTPTPEPARGEIRVVRRFAWIPVTLVNGDQLWLQTYYATEQWGKEWDGMTYRHVWGLIARTSRDPSADIASLSPQTPPHTEGE